MKNNLLKRYWIKFEKFSYPTPLNLGCGITAFDVEDAKEILKTYPFQNGVLPSIVDIEENIDISTLDNKHILPNIGLVTDRGIWFPQVI